MRALQKMHPGRHRCVVVLLPLLTACIKPDISDLESYVEETKARPGSGAPPLPEFKRVPPYTYQAKAKNIDSPFQLYYEEEEAVADSEARESIPPQWLRELDAARNREELEQFELDSLRMVGVINRVGEELWAIIIDPQNVVHRVRTNNYIGRNVGKIINITENRLEVRELIRDGQGRWGQREASLSLVEEQG